MDLRMLAVFILAMLSHMASADTQQQQALSAASSGFSQRLYQEVAKSKSNAIYSPYSIHSALTMTYFGARGDTANEMASTLGITSLPGAAAHQAYHDLIRLMNTAKSVTLSTGNAIFMNPSMTIEPDFITGVKSNYLAESDNFDLGAPGGPEKEINDYVADMTHDMIKNIIPEGSINGDTVMILINTIFFNGTWSDTFSKDLTHKQDFHLPGGANKQVDMMFDGDKSVYLKKDNVNKVDVLRLPFKGGRFGLYIALPQEVDGISDLENMLSVPGKVDELLSGLVYTRVQLSLPKFKIETSVNLKSVLKKLGMTRAFSPVGADFSGISKPAQVYISQVLHKAVIEVQETGTVAAAATSIGIVSLSVMMPPTEKFVADHPFVFFLKDTQTGQILFQGKFSG